MTIAAIVAGSRIPPRPPPVDFPHAAIPRDDLPPERPPAPADLLITVQPRRRSRAAVLRHPLPPVPGSVPVDGAGRWDPHRVGPGPSAREVWGDENPLG